MARQPQDGSRQKPLLQPGLIRAPIRKKSGAAFQDNSASALDMVFPLFFAALPV
jgi:hypothetical protein